MSKSCLRQKRKMTKPIRRLTAEDYAVDAVTGAKALVGAWLCRRFDDGTCVKFTSAQRIGITYASKRDQNRTWRFTLKHDA